MQQIRRRPAGQLESSQARKRVGWIALLALLAGWFLAAEVVFARDFEAPGSSPTASPVPYHEGPVNSVPVRAPARAAGAEELLGLSALAAILYGLRVSDLGRASRPR